MSFFEHTTDTALDRWTSNGHDYALGLDSDAPCPAGDIGSSRNAARRVGEEWDGDTSVVDHPQAVTETYSYGDGEFEAVAISDRGEAHMVVRCFAHWAEGDVYAAERDGEYLGDIYTADGVSPDRAYIEQSF